MTVFSQEVPQTVSNRAIYDFLDELAGQHIITINSAVKPYSSLFIARSLQEAEKKKEQLNMRQQKELGFYMRDFGKEGVTAQRRNGVKEEGVTEEEGVTAQGRKGVKEERRNGTLRYDLFYYRDSLFSLTVNPILGGRDLFKFIGKSHILS